MRNWLILLSYSGASFLNGLAWVTLIPIADKAMAYYQINEEELTLYSYSFALISIPFAPISAWVISKSFYISLHIIWMVSLLGTILRYFAMRDFWLSFIGQTLIGSGNMLMLASCSTLAGVWFPPSQVVLATSVAASLNFVGMGFAFVYIPYFQNISDLMLIQMIMAAVFWIFNMIILKKDPIVEVHMTFKEGLIVGLKDKVLVTMAVCCGSGLAVSYAIISIFGLLLIEENYSIHEIGWLGFAFLFSALFGSLLSSYIAEVKKSTGLSLKIFLILSVLSSALFAVFIEFKFVSIGLAVIFGACITGVLPLSIRACIEYLPVIHESISTNLIYLTAQIFSSLYTYPIQFFKWLTGFSGFFLASFIILVSFAWFYITVRKIKRERLGEDEVIKDAHINKTISLIH